MKMTGCLADWSTERINDCLAQGLTNLLIDWLANRLTGYNADQRNQIMTTSTR